MIFFSQELSSWVSIIFNNIIFCIVLHFKTRLLKGSQDNVSGEIKPYNVIWNMSEGYGILGGGGRLRPSMRQALEVGRISFLELSSGW